MAKIPAGVGPRNPQVVVLFGATGDLARRKLLPGLFHLASVGFIPGCRIVGVSLDPMDAEQFRAFARAALDEFSTRPIDDERWRQFAATLDYLPLSEGADALRLKVETAEQSLDGESRRLHYLSVPPSAALSAVKMLGDAHLVERSRIIMEKPFGTDLASAVSLNAQASRGVRRGPQIFRIDHFLGKEPAQNILAFRFANGLFEPIWNRNFIDHVQIDVPETLGLGTRSRVSTKQTGAYRDMVVTHLFQILASWRWSRRRRSNRQPISEEKNKVFRSMLPIDPTDVVRGQYTGYRSEDWRRPRFRDRDLHRLKCFIDNWRWAGVPFYLRTGKRLAEGQRIISIAFREPPKSMFPAGSGVGAQGPDHLTFDLADASKMSLSFYGKRPGPGHAARQAELAVRHARHGATLRRGARSVRAADPRRDAGRSHAVHHRGRHRAPVGGLDAAARGTAAGALLRAGVVGSERDPPVDRTTCMASAVRAKLAGFESQRGLNAGRTFATRSGCCNDMAT